MVNHTEMDKLLIITAMFTLATIDMEKLKEMEKLLE